ncbi:Trs85p KNAG_0H03270 [Huiozyma naganishii CBS 8797]|uniref:Trafficking protein particle complex III-specific subunit 85 n=1 Tax=Huiozyma naganishii (strain ATCC MYA-139 / BCRC 22969 / CBS 8797 / KCTC 17520 / NBRC 10181 / NCYC 3082 / Yp74L-3) TaxID=1071383 RepID=J7S1Z5_HUIN7|nr:hypothetical protein KNAG_0H03270 [Kazachstania naganishii CBS 8797]CCK71742.1 hypothetical protein KNAG_0H03270 [Kazachstania naganishii CBS 8797]
MAFSYEHYMNLLSHLECASETVPPDIARRIVSHAVAPVITVTSSLALDDHIMESYKVQSAYLLFRLFGGCISDRDQLMEHYTLDDSSTGGRTRKRSNSLFQRDATQSQFIRFAQPLPDLLRSYTEQQGLFDNDSLEWYLTHYLSWIQKLTATDPEKVEQLPDELTPSSPPQRGKPLPHKLLRNAVYHNFFALAVSSTTRISPFETFNVPVMNLIAIDVSRGQDYEVVRDLVTTFKNLNKFLEDFPVFINVNDILPMIVLCYDAADETQLATCEQLQRKIKKCLFVDSIPLALWDEDPESPLVPLHEPIMSSLDEIVKFYSSNSSAGGDEVGTDGHSRAALPLNIITHMYQALDVLVDEMLIPFMHRKTKYWEENILQPRKSIFHGSNNFFKKFIGKTTTQRDPSDTQFFPASSTECLLRKLADWSLMLSDFKTAYLTYDSLSNDLQNSPNYLASCLEWCAVSLLLGAQNIVTVKMIKTEITPLIERAVATYRQQGRSSYETRCMILSAELFLALRDTWTSTPYAIRYLETILRDCPQLGACSQVMIWERLSDCYQSRTDPRVASALSTNTSPGSAQPGNEILAQGFTRKRKAAFFRLIAAKKWAEQGQWRQVQWCLHDIKDIYTASALYDKKGLLIDRLNTEVQSFSM